ncbi:hypothetical protein Tco_0104250 [Tanacetum coccineum]
MFYKRGQIDKTLFIKRVKGDILLVQVYVDDIIFGSTKKGLCTEFEKLMHKKFQMSSMASTPIETSKPLLKHVEAEDVDVHLYRSMIGSLMYLTDSRPDIMFDDSPFDLEAYTDSDYAGASLDRKSTIGGCQFLRRRLISWQYFIDKKGTICIVKNQCFTKKISHIKIRHNFIGIHMREITFQVDQRFHTDHNVVDLLTKAFDVSRFQYLIANYLKEWEDRMERAATIASSLEAEQDSGNINRTQSMATLNESFPQGTGSVHNDPPLSRVNTMGKWGGLHETKGIDGILYQIKIQALVDKKKVIITEKSVRSDLMLEDAEGTECLPNDVIFEQLTLMGSAVLYLIPIPHHYFSTSSSKPQKKKSRRKQRKDSGPIEPIPEEATNEEPISTPSSKTAQAKEIASLKKRVKQLEKRRKSRTLGLKRLRKVGSASRVESSNDVSLGAQEDASKQGRKIADLDDDAEVTLVDETQERNDEELMFDTDVLNGDEVFEEPIVNVAKTTSSFPISVADPVTTAGEVVTTASATTTIDELTLAQTLIEIKAAKPKAVTTVATIITTAVASTRPKAKNWLY